MQTILSVIQWAVNHDSNYWNEPYKFAPERWLGDPKYQTDKLGKRPLFPSSLPQVSEARFWNHGVFVCSYLQLVYINHQLHC